MVDLIQKTQRETYRALRVKPPGHGRKTERWLSPGNIGQLIDLYSAQWEHLSALSNEMRWMRSLPDRPCEVRRQELQRLHAEFLELGPPDWVKPGLSVVLERTLDLAAAFMAGGRKAHADSELSAEIRQQQDGLDEALRALHRYEAQLTGPVPPIVAADLFNGA